MPRIPTYQPGQVGAVQTTGARFRAADNGGGVAGAFASGMAQLGNAMGQYAQVQDRINAENDDTQARKMAVEAAGKISALTQQYRSLMGGNAREAQERTLKEIAAIRDQYVGQATNDRMRGFLEQRLGTIYQDEVSAVSGHALKEAQVERLSTLASERTMFADRAVNEDDPIKRQQSVTMGIQALEAEMDQRGLVDPNVRALEIKKYTSGVHRDVIDREMTRPDRDVDLVEAYYEANKDEMTADDRRRVLNDMRPLLVERQTEDDVARAVMGMKPVAGEGELGGGRFNADSALKFIVSELEGGAKLNTDTGGLTKYGISTKGNPGVDVANLSEGQALGIYRKKYMRGLPLDQMTDAAATVALDASVNHGPEFAKSIVEKSGGDPRRMLELRRAEYQRLVRENPEKYGPYAKGWENRLAKLEARIGGTQTEAPGAWDKDEAYRRIDALGDAEGWSLERRNAAKAKVDREIGKREELLARQEREASDAAFKVVVELGDGFTSINQIPRQVRDQLSPEALARLTDQAGRNAEAKTVIPAKGAAATELEILKRTDPEAFARVNLQTYLGKVNADELRGFVLDQASMVGKPKPANDYRSGIQSAIAWGEKYGGTKIDKADFPAVYDFMESQLLEIKRAKGRVDARDYNDAFNTAMRTVRKPGLLWDGEQPLYRALTDVPPEIEQQIRDNWKGSRPPSKGEIISAYRQILTGK